MQQRRAASDSEDAAVQNTVAGWGTMDSSCMVSGASGAAGAAGTVGTAEAAEASATDSLQGAQLRAAY